ncbi:MAG TPA: COX15/CtaA family protein, partial [Longimicrobiales bacterium]|nr:COX15/CtaA family protein [Longimicrobiales bacterium]
MDRPLHHRAFVVSVVWTLVLLFLGSVVHATESSLACPDWPTCYGSLVPEMSGGVFWEHLHRLVAGGLILMWLLATYLAWGPGRDRPVLRKAAVAGLALLLVQAVLGGITVILRLPDAVSTSHLGLAFLFLALATVLAVITAPGWREREPGSDTGSRLAVLVAGAAALVFLQSLLGAWVRHADAGMACPDIPLCLGEWVPPLEQRLVAIHWLHRGVGVLTGLVVVGVAGAVVARGRTRRVRLGAIAAGALVLAQVGLGFLSVQTVLSV